MQYNWFADYHPSENRSPWELNWDDPNTTNINRKDRPWTQVDPWSINHRPLDRDHGQHRWVTFDSAPSDGLPIVAIPLHQGWRVDNIRLICDYLLHESRSWILRNPQTQIIINYSPEGFGSEVYPSMHRIAEILQIRPKQLLYVSGSINNQSMYDTWCRSNDISFDQRIRTSYELFWLRCIANKQLNTKQLSVQIEHDDLRERIVCLNRRLHPHRIFLAVELARLNAIHKIRYSLPKIIKEPYAPAFDFDQLWHRYRNLFLQEPYANDRIKAAQLLYHKILPLSADDKDLNINLCSDLSSELAIFPINVITETHFFNDLHFPSEKIFKPMMYGQAFLPIASPGYSASLEKAGFKVFNHINQEIDQIVDHGDRLTAAAMVINRLISMPLDEFNLILKRSVEDAIHNQMLVINNQISRRISTSQMKKDIETYVHSI